MAAPALCVEAAFTSRPTDSTYTPWTNITAAVRGLTYTRGRDSELTDMVAGTSTVIVADPSGNFDPRKTTSPYYPNIKPERPIRARAILDGTSYPLFQHYAERWPRSERSGNTYAQREITSSDMFELLARGSLAGQTFPQERSDARVTRVLNLPPTYMGGASAAVIGTGSSDVIGGSYGPEEAVSPLEHLHRVASAENGILVVDAYGRLVFKGRHSMYGGVMPGANFTDRPGSGGYPYVQVSPSSDKMQLLNSWAVNRYSDFQTVAEVVNAEDAPSVLEYSRRAQTLDSWVTTTAEAVDQAFWNLHEHKEPMELIESFTVVPGNNSALWALLLSLTITGIGERVTVSETPPGFSSAIVNTYTIQRMTVTFPSGPTSAASFTFGLSKTAALSGWLIFDDPAYGKFDANAFAY